MTSYTRLFDPVLPGFGTATDAKEMRTVLTQAFRTAGERVDIADLGIADVRYQPRVSAEILYRVKVRDPAAGKSRKLLLNAQVLPAGQRPNAPPARLVERYTADESFWLRTPHVWLPELGMSINAFPIDPELPTLFDALDERRIRDALAALWRGRRVRVRSVRAELLGYTPHNRAAFFYEVLAEDKDGGVPEVRRLIGKLHGKKSADRLFAGSWALWRALESKCRLAPPVGHLPELGLTLQEHVRGERLAALAGQPTFAKRVRQTARALAALHDSPIPLATRRKPSEEARVVHRWSGVLMAIRSDMADRIERLRDRLAAELEARVEMTGPVHADFHHTNVLVDDDGITIIDLDEMAYGDPLLDVGRFLASLRIPSLRTFGTIDGLASAGDVFLSEYLRQRPEDERRVRLFEAACLFTAAASAFRIQRRAWPEEVELLTSEAERVFALAGAHTAPPPAARELPPFPVAENARAFAQDAVYMRTLLAQPVRSAYGGAMTSFVVHPDKNGAVARYDVKGRAGREKWSAALHGVAHTGGAAVLTRGLDALRNALAKVVDAPVLPQPIADIRQLGMVVIDAPAGEKLSALLDTPGATARCAQVGRALAALASTDVQLEKQRDFEHELHRLERKLQQLADAHPGFHARAAALLARLRVTSADARVTNGPTFGGVRPGDVYCDGERVALARLESPYLGPVFMDAAELLAQLTLAGARNGGPANAHELKNALRAGYAERAVHDVAHIEMVETAVLLRLACAQVERAQDGAIPERLLAAAEALA